MLFLTGLIASIATYAPIPAPPYLSLALYLVSGLILLLRIRKRDPSGADILVSFLFNIALCMVFGLFVYVYFAVIGIIPLLERDYSSPQGNSELFHILGILLIFLFIVCIGRIFNLAPFLYKKIIVQDGTKNKSKKLVVILETISAALLPIVSALTIIKMIIDLVHR